MPDQLKPAERHRAQRLRRVFGLEIETCAVCGGKVRVMASIGDPPACMQCESQTFPSTISPGG